MRLSTELKAQVAARYPLEKMKEAVAYYHAFRSQDAVLLVLNQEE
jgi:hypothetical protein